MKRKGQTGIGDLATKVMLIVAVPILLLIGITVYSTFQDAADNPFETDYVNETQTGIATPGPQIVTLDNPPILNNTQLSVFNGTNDGTGITNEHLDQGTDYNINSLADGELNLSNTLTNVDAINVSYTGHEGRGHTSVQGTNQNTYSGFNLAAVLPIVVAGAAILVIFVGTLMGITG